MLLTVAPAPYPARDPLRCEAAAWKDARRQIASGRLRRYGTDPADEVLAVRETRVAGICQQSIELQSMQTLETKRKADKPDNLGTFYRWQDAAWKSGTVALR